MPTFTFEGFTEGSLVALSAAQGALGASGSVPHWRLSNMNTATIDFISHTQPEVVAPAVVWFEATGFSGFNVEEPANPDGGRAYDPTAHDITHIWDFDDTGTFGDHLNIPTAWRLSGVDYGKKAVHVFRAGRTYDVGLWSVDRAGASGARTRSVIVQDPGDAYPGTRTICVSSASDFSGKPTGAQEATSISAARAALAALGTTGRILLRRGEEYTGNFAFGNDLDNVHIGNFGDEADPRPIWRPVYTASGGGACISGSNSTAGFDVTIWGIDFQGEWDATLETGDARGDAIELGSLTGSEYNVLVYQCRISGMGATFWNNSTAHRTAFVDCEITHHQSWALSMFDFSLSPNKRTALVGCFIGQPENACAGGTTSLGNQYGPLRNEGEDEMIISASSFYQALTFNYQWALRLFSANENNPGGQFLNMNRTVVEGGISQINLRGQNAGTPDRPGNFIFDTCLYVLDYRSIIGSITSYGGVTQRNILVVVPNISSVTTTGYEFAFSYERPNSGAENNNAKRQLYNCTVLNLRGSDGITFLANTSGLTDVTTQNNVHHEPNLGTPNTPFAPIDLTSTIAGYTTKNRGRRVSPAKPSQSINVANGATFTVAYPSGTGQSDYNSAGRHSLFIGSDAYFSYRGGEISVSFGASNITVTNNTGGTLSGTATMAFERSTLTTDPAYGSAPTMPLPLPMGPRSPDGPLQAHTQFDTADRVRVLGAV